MISSYVLTLPFSIWSCAAILLSSVLSSGAIFMVVIGIVIPAWLILVILFIFFVLGISLICL